MARRSDRPIFIVAGQRGQELERRDGKRDEHEEGHPLPPEISLRVVVIRKKPGKCFWKTCIRP